MPATTTGFDPTSLTRDEPTESLPRKKRQPKKQSSSPLDSVIQKQSELLAAGYDLMDRIEQRHAGELSSAVSISDSEWLVIIAAGIIEAKNQHRIARMLNRCRSARMLRQQYMDMGPRKTIENSLSKAVAAEEQARSFLEKIDLTRLEGTEKANGLNAQLSGFEEDRKSAERSLERSDRLFASLMRLAPEPIHNFVKSEKQQLAIGDDARRLSRVSMEVAGLEKLLDPNNLRQSTESGIPLSQQIPYSLQSIPNR